MFCAISGEVPQEPVVSKKNGYLYEKRLIEKYIREEGKCPISGLDLVESDLIPIQTNKAVKPRVITSSGIPGILSMLQNEWDEHMLEMFTLKQHLDSTRQELSQALYQHDAACRVIARLMRERDEARAMLSSLQSQGLALNAGSSVGSASSAHVGNGEAPMDADDNTALPEATLDASVIDAINTKCAELSSGRRGRKVPEGLSSKETISAFAISASHTPHKSDKPGVTCLSVQPGSTPDAVVMLLSGGVDKEALLTDRISGRVAGKMTGHSKKISGAVFHPLWPSDNTIFTSSADKSVKVWRGKETDSSTSSEPSYRYSEALTVCCHSDEVTGLTVHPTGSFGVSVSLDSNWCFLDLSRGVALRTVSTTTDASASSGLLCGQFHPDGLILATGTRDSVLKIWDVRQQNNVANCADHSGAVSGISFSENGYLLASASHDGTVMVWDLRKLKCIKTLTVGDGKQPVNALAFDLSGSYLAVGADELSVLSVKASKDWSDVALPDPVRTAHSKPVSAVAWGPLAAFLTSASADRTVKVYS